MAAGLVPVVANSTVGGACSHLLAAGSPSSSHPGATVRQMAEEVCRGFRGALDRERHHAFLPRLAAAGLAPRIVRMDERQRCLERCTPFATWRRSVGATELSVMRAAVLDLIADVHALGVCHRDLHEGNLVVRGDRPLVIDLELACEVDPGGLCYDLTGPCEAIPVAEQHLDRADAYAEHGVWWDSPCDGLAKVFGPLDHRPEVAS